MELKKLNRSQLREAEAVFSKSQDYLKLEGSEVDSKVSARQFFDTLPPRKAYVDKFNFGIYEEGKLVGLLDYIRAYPQAGTDFVALLLLEEGARQKGLGSQVQQEIISLAQSHGAQLIQLTVLKNNPKALHFWISQGFRPIKETRSLGSRANKITLLELEI